MSSTPLVNEILRDLKAYREKQSKAIMDAAFSAQQQRIASEIGWIEPSSLKGRQHRVEVILYGRWAGRKLRVYGYSPLLGLACWCCTIDGIKSVLGHEPSASQRYHEDAIFWFSFTQICEMCLEQ